MSEKQLLCHVPQTPAREFMPGVDDRRSSLILVSSNKFPNGATLHYYFFESGSLRGSQRQMDLIHTAFAVWKSVGIGLNFKHVTDIRDAEVRIGFEAGAGSWSYLGRDILNRAIVGPNERTMNIGWDDDQTLDTCIHEIGHTLGFPHEHQNPNAGIVWNEEAVYTALGGPPNNWSRETTYWNIIRKIDPDTVQGSAWDANSIMHYPFRAGMILKPERYQTSHLLPEPGLSDRDKLWVNKFYPPIEVEPKQELVEGRVTEITVGEGESQMFVIQGAQGKYKIYTQGDADTFCTLFKVTPSGENQEIAADDDSGEEKNATIEASLTSGAEYNLQVRLYWIRAGQPKPTVHLEKLADGGGCDIL